MTDGGVPYSAAVDLRTGELFVPIGSFGGVAGVQRVLTILREELELAMALCGCPTLDRISPEILFSQE